MTNRGWHSAFPIPHPHSSRIFAKTVELSCTETGGPRRLDKVGSHAAGAGMSLGQHA